MMEISSIRDYLQKEKHIAPLVTFRVVFGGIMLFSIIRFAANGWIYTQYIQPQFFFSFFEWVQPLSATGMYALFFMMALSAACIMLGAFYRVATILFFLSFTYVELIDKTNYLNHYYFVSIISFILIWLPAHRAISIDAWRKPSIQLQRIPAWCIHILCLQLGLVYFYAGLAKLNPDWLFHAMPMKIWLPSKANLPVIGWFFDYYWVAFVFSWFGALYDLSIPFFLAWKRSRFFAYLTVIAFHLMTGLLFQIGMFPYIMIGCTLIFFSEEFHLQLWGRIGKLFPFRLSPQTLGQETEVCGDLSPPLQKNYWIPSLLAFHLIIQIILPWRFMLFPGNLFWTEQGYRFSWRVMLMEKAGYVTFLAKDPESKNSMEIDPADYLTPVQEKMMSTQPDMILQFAHYLASQLKNKGIEQPEIYAQSYVALNGRSSQKFIDDQANLAAIPEGWQHKWWVLPFEK